MKKSSENHVKLNQEQRSAQAYKLFLIGKEKFAKGDFISAEKCLLRAEGLFPTPEAKKLLNLIKIKTKKTKSSEATRAESNQQSNQIASSSPSCSGEGRRRRTSSHPSTEPDYTIEQLEAVRRVFKSQNLYIILNVNPDATTAEIIESYKKLALLVHPDKNKAPGAKEAFQVIGNAKDVLSNTTMRMEYDEQLQRTTEQEAFDLQQFPMPNFNFDIPTWLIIGGVTLCAAGFVGLWWKNKENKSHELGKTTQKRSRQHDERMSQDD